MKNNAWRTVSLCLAVIMIMALTVGAAPYFDRQDKAHQIAELARELGLPEDDPIIVRAKEIWYESDAAFCRDRDIIACTVYNEGWGDCTTEHRELIAAVIVNRVNMGYGGATSVYDVITQPKQYLPAYADPNSKYWKNASADPEIWAECQRIATKALRGEVDCPPDVIYQANFPQASYGKEIVIFKQFKACGNWTYFCYG